MKVNTDEIQMEVDSWCLGAQLHPDNGKQYVQMTAPLSMIYGLLPLRMS